MSAYAINKICYLVGNDLVFRGRILKDISQVLTEFKLDPEERLAFEEGDVATLFQHGGHIILLLILPRYNIGGLTQAEYDERIAALNW